MANTLAYYDIAKDTAMKSFIVQAFGVILIKLCTKTRVFVADNMIFKIKAGVYPCEPPLDGPFYEGQNSGHLKWATGVNVIFVLFHSL